MITATFALLLLTTSPRAVRDQPTLSKPRYEIRTLITSRTLTILKGSFEGRFRTRSDYVWPPVFYISKANSVNFLDSTWQKVLPKGSADFPHFTSLPDELPGTNLQTIPFKIDLGDAWPKTGSLLICMNGTFGQPGNANRRRSEIGFVADEYTTGFASCDDRPGTQVPLTMLRNMVISTGAARLPVSDVSDSYEQESSDVGPMGVKIYTQAVDPTSGNTMPGAGRWSPYSQSLSSPDDIVNYSITGFSDGLITILTTDGYVDPLGQCRNETSGFIRAYRGGLPIDMPDILK